MVTVETQNLYITSDNDKLLALFFQNVRECVKRCSFLSFSPCIRPSITPPSFNLRRVGTFSRNLKQSHCKFIFFNFLQWRTEGGFQTPPLEIPKALQNRAKHNPIVKTVKIAEFRMPTLQDVWKRGSTILKLQPVRNCFTLAVTNKLVVIINNLEVPKIKKLLLYEMEFLLPNYSCLQNH